MKNNVTTELRKKEFGNLYVISSYVTIERVVNLLKISKCGELITLVVYVREICEYVSER